jgi:hypothetical protein
MERCGGQAWSPQVQPTLFVTRDMDSTQSHCTNHRSRGRGRVYRRGLAKDTIDVNATYEKGWTALALLERHIGIMHGG